MKPRQTVESYWSVWIFNNSTKSRPPFWEPYDEGMTTKAVATKEMRDLAKRYPDERFDIVRTVNTRQSSPTGSDPK